MMRFIQVRNLVKAGKGHIVLLDQTTKGTSEAQCPSLENTDPDMNDLLTFHSGMPPYISYL